MSNGAEGLDGQHGLGTQAKPPERRVHSHPGTGSFIIPVENTWAAHAEQVVDSANHIQFDPQRYAYFDGVIAQKLGNPALTDPTHADYGKLHGMRENIALLRNFILSHYETSGMFADGDEPQMARLRSIAEGLGDGLGNDHWISRAVTISTSSDVARIPGVGAAEMYKYLLEVQEKPAVLQETVSRVKSFFLMPDRVWDLPPLEQSPFSPANLAAPPPNFKSAFAPPPKKAEESDDNDIQERDQKQEQQKKTESAQGADPVDQSIILCEGIVKKANQLRSIETLEEAPREESVEEARKILRFLRNMEFTDRNMEEFLDMGNAQVVVAKKQAFSRLVDIFDAHLKHAQHKNPNVARNNPAVENAINTSSTLALELAEHTRRILREDDAREERLNRLIDSLPPQAELRINQSVDQLLQTMELGIERTSDRTVESATHERLSAASDRIQEAASALHHPDNMPPPSREESLELARDMLQQMQKAPFLDQTLDEFVQSGRPEEKAAFAQQMGEFAELFRNLVSEAANNNSDIIRDNDLKQASDSLQGFAAAVKLMAAKEIPNSLASTQNISSANEGNMEHWQQHHDKTVDRILKTAEGALEKTLEDIAMDDDDREEDLMKEAVEVADHNTSVNQHHKKKKRRRGETSSRSGKGQKKQKKVMLNLTADDIYLKQGRFAEDSRDIRVQASSATALKGLKSSDLEAIKQLGGSLREIGSELQDLQTTTTNLVRPDDRSRRQQLRDTERQAQQQRQNNPRGNGQGPR
jgi:hypothetical protein